MSSPCRVKAVSISCILTLHNEGYLAHKSIMSIMRAMNYAEQHGITCQLIIVMDRAGPETFAYIQDGSFLSRGTIILSTDFGDPGLARNFGITQARGKYCAIFDGDDLCSENWLYQAQIQGESDPNFIVHSEFNIYFGRGRLVTRHIDQREPTFRLAALLVENYWSALCFAALDVFLRFPYVATPRESGYGYEDWHWNCELIGAGYTHVIAPGTAHFIRLKTSGSRNQDAAQRTLVMRHSSLFDDIDAFRSKSNVDVPVSLAVTKDTRGIAPYVQSSVQNRPGLAERLAKQIYARLPSGQVKSALRSCYATCFEPWLNWGQTTSQPPLPAERCDAVQNWDEDAYLECHPDVRDAVKAGKLQSGLEHWVKFGEAEGRRLAFTRLPVEVREEMRNLSSIELEIYPSERFFSDCEDYQVNVPIDLGDAFAHVAGITKNVSHVFLLPWLIRGGADLVAIHHINCLAENFGAKIIVITTEDRESPWLDRLNPGVKVVEFGRHYLTRLSRKQQQMVLVRYLLKSKPAVVHNINSELAWEIFALHGRALSEKMKLFSSLFAFEFSPEGEPLGYARDLGKTQSNLWRVLTDNKTFVKTLRNMYGIPELKFHAYSYPQHVLPRFSFDTAQPIRIIWAGRFVRQKRPDILLKIAKMLPDVVFDVYGAPMFSMTSEMQQIYDDLAKIPNVKLKGGYDGFDSIVDNNYAMLLYTTQFDGLPNVILEAMASGLPVLAPDIGGIREVVTPESGFLIDRFDDVAAFVNSIKYLLENPSQLDVERQRALDLIRTKHSMDAFCAALAETQDYLPPS